MNDEITTTANNSSCSSNGSNIHPFEYLCYLAKQWNVDVYSEEFSLRLDKNNLWPSCREKFHYPKLKDLPNVDLSLVADPDADCIYFCGNSLGLQPKKCKEYVDREFDKWAKIGVHGHKLGDLPWESSEDHLKPGMARLAGALDQEVSVMNFLTVNLHLLLISFYQPTATRYKVLLEDKAFPSDHVILSMTPFQTKDQLCMIFEISFVLIKTVCH
jgi:kynureninase